MTIIEQNQLEHVRTWLNGEQNYTRGLMLLKAYSPNKPLVASLDQWENKPLLHRLLMEMYEELKSKETQEPESVNMIAIPEIEIEQAVPIAAEHSKPALKRSDEKKLEQLDASRKKLYRDSGMWHSQMCMIGCDEDGNEKPKLSDRDKERRLELAKMILEARTEINELWAITDHFTEHGTFPSEKEKTATAPQILSKGDAFKRLKNSVAPNISKLKKKISGAADGPQKNEWLYQLGILEKEKLELETLIK